MGQALHIVDRDFTLSSNPVWAALVLATRTVNMGSPTESTRLGPQLVIAGSPHKTDHKPGIYIKFWMPYDVWRYVWISFCWRKYSRQRFLTQTEPDPN